MLILGVESSCDETAAAVLQNGERILSNVINSQVELHAKYGGVVPELASRKHIENIYFVVQEALDNADITLDELDGLAVTAGPGLIGALLVGLSFVKAISYAKKIPYVGVDHISGHITSVLLGKDKPSFPYIALIASGGHSSIFHVDSETEHKLLGRSRDDAAGEAFDKVAKLLSLEYPGGPIISKLSKEGKRDSIAFPRAWLEPESLDFSFSGLKTSVASYVRKMEKQDNELNIPDICASFQEAVVEVLVEKTLKAAKVSKINNIVLGGGVASNIRLREFMRKRGTEEGVQTFITPPEFCTDNAVMIALAGYHHFDQATTSYDMDVYSRSNYIT